MNKFKVGDRVRVVNSSTLAKGTLDTVESVEKHAIDGGSVYLKNARRHLNWSRVELANDVPATPEYYMIKNLDSRGATSVVHGDETKARAELERLSKAIPGRRFALFKATEVMVTETVTTYDTKVTKL